jgi:hypothetical protein
LRQQAAGDHHFSPDLQSINYKIVREAKAALYAVRKAGAHDDSNKAVMRPEKHEELHSLVPRVASCFRNDEQ